MNKDFASNTTGAWQDFWAQEVRNQDSPNARREGNNGCLPTRYRSILQAQKQVWTDFAQILPKKARVLDLASGDGQVLQWLLLARPKAKLIGTDLAPELPEPPRGTKLRANVAMEALPFQDGAFDAVVSQFGFEYGDTALAAGEIARVLKPGGEVALLTHRIDGPILAHNMARAEQVRWVLQNRDLIAVAKRSLALREMGIAAVPLQVTRAVAEGADKYGAGSAAWEIAEAIRQTLVLSGHDNPRNVAALLDKIAAKAGNELGRIASLEQACRTTDDEEGFAAALARGGLVEHSRVPVHDDTQNAPFADFRKLAHIAK